MFDKMKQLYDMQKKAKDLQKQMESIRIEKTSRDGLLRVTVNGTSKVENLSVDPSYLTPQKRKELEKSLQELINEGVSEIQQQTAAQAAQLMKGLNIPGL